ncbi:MAG: DUF115 domain-containing protein [Magnetococcales bacterium]|nr:DUF115 domain-containing protein [Magnetococcales bacterium]
MSSKILRTTTHNPIPIETIFGQIRSTLRRNLPTLGISPPRPETLTIVGSGPSLNQTWHRIEHPVMACNRAVGWLLDKGHTPWTAFYWDPQPTLTPLIRVADGIVYLVASQCRPVVFDMLAGKKVVTWHANIGEPVERVLAEFDRQKEPIIRGGSTAVMRAIYVGYVMGFRAFELHGVDGSFQAHQLHADGSTLQGDYKRVRVVYEGREFMITDGLINQANEFSKTVALLQDCRIRIHGDGLIPHMARGMGIHAEAS